MEKESIAVIFIIAFFCIALLLASKQLKKDETYKKRPRSGKTKIQKQHND